MAVVGQQGGREVHVSEDEMLRLEMLFEELSALYGPTPIPTEKQLEKAQMIHAELDELFDGAPLSSEAHDHAGRLFAQLDGIFETRKRLSKAEQKRVDDLSDEIDGLLGRYDQLDGRAP